jgi:hypothetical protein
LPGGITPNNKSYPRRVELQLSILKAFREDLDGGYVSDPEKQKEFGAAKPSPGEIREGDQMKKVERKIARENCLVRLEPLDPELANEVREVWEAEMAEIAEELRAETAQELRAETAEELRAETAEELRAETAEELRAEA